jgi:hypothetical protein
MRKVYVEFGAQDCPGVSWLFPGSVSKTGLLPNKRHQTISNHLTVLLVAG